MNRLMPRRPERWRANDSLKVRAHIFVFGLVQAVFFRETTRRMADKHHVKGWVRNLPDGRVEAVFEGEENDVDELVKFCSKGPPTAIVSKLKVVKEAYSGKFDSFDIL